MLNFSLCPSTRSYQLYRSQQIHAFAPQQFQSRLSHLHINSKLIKVAMKPDCIKGMLGQVTISFLAMLLSGM